MKNQNQTLIENENGLLLHDKVAVIFGAGGAIGSRVAREFSHEGATVLLSGRRLDPVEKVLKDIRSSNAKADAAEVRPHAARVSSPTCLALSEGNENCSRRIPLGSGNFAANSV